jgi:hypothetical protein
MGANQIVAFIPSNSPKGSKRPTNYTTNSRALAHCAGNNSSSRLTLWFQYNSAAPPPIVVYPLPKSTSYSETRATLRAQ